MSNGRAIKASLWREGLSLFRQGGHEWIKWAVCFLIVYIPCDFWLLKVSGPFNAAFFEALKNYHPGAGTLASQVKNIPQPSKLPNLILTFVYSIQLYFFVVLYLRKSPILDAPRLGFGSFFYAFMKEVQKFLAVTGFVLLAILAIIIIDAIILLIAILVLGKGKIALGLMAAGGVFVLAQLAAMIYFGARFSLVYPLAVERITSALKVSSQLTRGNICRIVGNGFILWLPLLLAGWAVYIGILMTPAYWESNLVTALLAVVSSVMAVITMGVTTAFVCSASRILYREKLQIDPDFALVKRT